MSGGIVNTINSSLSGIFPERRVYIRSDARTRYWTFSPVSQCAATALFLGFVGWSAFTSLAFIDKAMDGRTAENRLEAMQEAYEIKLAALREQQRLAEEELNRSNTRGDLVTQELSEKQRLLVDKASRLRSAETELEGLRREFEVIVHRQRQEREQVNALNEEVVGLRLALAEAERASSETDDTLAVFADTMRNVIDARDRASRRASTLDTRVAVLETEIGQWEARQESLLAQLEEATNTSLTALDGIFVGSDIDLDTILKQTKRDYTGRGGGPVDDEERSDAPQVDTGVRVAALMNDVERMSLMRVAIERMPFGEPTRGARRTSGFGYRRDPYRGTSRLHKGVDFAAPTGTPIYSTGEGVVTFSGRQSGYGIVVKIRHAFGFETVYAHLSKSRVKVGQRVERGDRVADMGSTGRSTGSHLHYEVRIDGKPVNPSKFIEAARNVL